MRQVDPASLLREARDAWPRAYAPYSGEVVGAALLTQDGTVVSAGNIENASWPLAMCAEHAALVCAIARGHHDFVAIAVSKQAGSTPLPCGQCRQALLEFGGPDLVVVLDSGKGHDGARVTMASLLPAG